MLYGAEQGGVRNLIVSLDKQHGAEGQGFPNGLYPARRVIWHLGEFKNNYSAFNISVNCIPRTIKGGSDRYKFIEVVVPSFQMIMYNPSGSSFPFTSGEYPTDIVIKNEPYGSVSSGMRVSALNKNGEELAYFYSGGGDSGFMGSIIRPTTLEITTTNSIDFYDAFPDFKVIWEMVDDINNYYDNY